MSIKLYRSYRSSYIDHIDHMWEDLDHTDQVGRMYTDYAERVDYCISYKITYRSHKPYRSYVSYEYRSWSYRSSRSYVYRLYVPNHIGFYTTHLDHIGHIIGHTCHVYRPWSYRSSRSYVLRLLYTDRIDQIIPDRSYRSSCTGHIV